MKDLSADSIKSAEACSILRDTLLPGFHMRVTPRGKSFYFSYRFRGEERRPKIGDYPALSVPQARELCRSILLDKAAGTDPLLRKAKFEHTCAALWTRYYKDRVKHKKSAAEDVRMWDKYLADRFAHRYVETVNYEDIASLHSHLSDTPYQANRLLSLLNAMFSFSVAPLKWSRHNPCAGVRRHSETSRKRYYSADELRSVCSALDRRAEKHPRSVALVYALLYTGARKSELATAKREWLTGNVLSLPDSKTGARTIVLPQHIAEGLHHIPPGRPLFGVTDPKKLWDAVRQEAGCPDLRMHDLRHSFASMALASGIGLSQIGELLGHASVQTTKRYAHLIPDCAASAVECTANAISAIIGRTTNAG